MNDLSHWAYAANFSIYEAAYLILGVDPSSSEASNRSARHIKERLEEGYKKAVEYINFRVFGVMRPDNYFETDPENSEPAPAHEQLLSVALEAQICALNKGDVASVAAWLQFGMKSVFDQRFTRKMLAKWIKDNQLVSKYCFDREIIVSGDSLDFGRHRTQALTVLCEAAHKFWNLYDPTDRTTAPTNDQIVDWLITERQVSVRTAQVMATILRPDDLPTGRRW